MNSVVFSPQERRRCSFRPDLCPQDALGLLISAKRPETRCHEENRRDIKALTSELLRLKGCVDWASRGCSTRPKDLGTPVTALKEASAFRLRLLLSEPLGRVLHLRRFRKPFSDSLRTLRLKDAFRQGDTKENTWRQPHEMPSDPFDSPFSCGSHGVKLHTHPCSRCALGGMDL